MAADMLTIVIHFFVACSLPLCQLASSSFLGNFTVKTPEVVWMLVGNHYAINCELTGNISKETVKMFWETNNKSIADLLSANIKEIRISSSHIQLKFLNATLAEAGHYACIAENQYGRIRSSTTFVNIGRSPEKFQEYKCSYDRNSNIVEFTPVLPQQSDVSEVDVKYCQSQFKNNFCRNNESVWINATCSNKTLSCLMKVSSLSRYSLQIVLKNRFGSTPAVTIPFNYFGKCTDQKPVIKNMYFINYKKIQISWKLPPGYIMAVLKVNENSSSTVIAEANAFVREGSKIIEVNLKPCTIYTTCITLLKTPQIKTCKSKQTEMRYDIPLMMDIQMADNIVMKTIEIRWRDPTEDTKGPFYYRCKLNVVKESKTVDTILRNTTLAMLSVQRPQGTQIIFTIQKCTNCACAYGVTKIFPLSRKPKSSPQVARETNALIIPWAVGGAALFLVAIVLGYFFYRRRRTTRTQREDSFRQTVTEDPGQIMPLNHHYEKVM